MAKMWNARVFAQVTFDFEIEADSESQVETAIKNYLPYIEYGKLGGKGKLDTQPISVKVDDGDEVTAIFVTIVTSLKET